jgi:hypothetical protein
LDGGCEGGVTDRDKLGDRDDDRLRAVEQLLRVDDRDPDQRAVAVVAKGMASAGLVEGDGLT